ncbi:cytochrome P450 2D1 [Strongylocentrotus purpuratus]|uniref:Cytochrome P450 n=1 Tax=Strongylocentrotus purpuratus TaxID=7668 RepID=A0A7M7RE88_STRPU|nr:cytochrome P450 2D1 [Strongylocentrotus purpuratus]|eukprot:XP_794646.2 PREDICTED: cytochrome P450 2D1 [Strongylocentrotus purpuratus]
MDLYTFLDPYAFFIMLMTVLVLYTQWFEYPISNVKPLPGPRTWSILGNLPQLIAARFDINDFHERLRKMYGAVVGYRIYHHNVVVINDLKLVREVANHPDFCGRMRSKLHANLSKEPNVGILTSYGHTWKEHHDVLSGFVTALSKSKQLEDICTIEATKFIKVLTDQTDKDLIIHHYSVQTLAVIFCQVIFGKVLDVNDDIVKEVVDIVMERQRESASATRRLLPSYVNNLTGSGAKRRHQLNVQFVALVKTLVGDHTKQTEILIPCFVRRYWDERHEKLQSMEDGSMTSLTSDNLLWACIDLVTVCVDEASLLLTQSLLLLASHPEVQSKLKEDICPKAREQDDQEPSAYLAAVQLETQRLAPDNPWSTSLMALSDVKLADFEILQDAVVVANWRYLRQGDDQDWDEPTQFQPGRFLGEDGSLVEHPQMISFPAGKRACPADAMSSSASSMLIRHICQRFKLSLPAQTTHPCDKNGLIQRSSLFKTKLRIVPH